MSQRQEYHSGPTALHVFFPLFSFFICKRDDSSMRNPCFVHDDSLACLILFLLSIVSLSFSRSYHESLL